MRSLTYTCSATGENVSLDGSDGHVYFGTVPKLRGFEWRYTLGEKTVTGLHRAAKSVEVTGKVIGSLESIDLMHAIFEADLSNGVPGTLSSDDGWTAKAYVVKAEPGDIYPTIVNITWSVILVEGVWRHETNTHYRFSQSDDTSTLDMPFDYPHDYAGMPASGTLHNSSRAATPVRLTVFGPASNPAITIGANRYEVDCDVPAGSRLVIDGVASPKTVTLIDAYGGTSNKLKDAKLGTGVNSGSYCFQQLPPGNMQVSSNGGFEFDVTQCEMRGEPLWN